MRFTSFAAVVPFVTLAIACSKPAATQAPETTNASSVASPTQGADKPTAATHKAEVGKPAPDFELKDLDGAPVKLSSFKGKTVVLEWFNPGCPFVKKAHEKASLKDAAKRATKDGVVWLAINSSSEGKQGFGVEVNREAKTKWSLEHPILLDTSGDVGHAYGATNTPHMYVIDKAGILVYRGAIDNSPDGEGESPTGGKLVHYVDEALAAVAAGKPLATTETKAYGCGVKYK